MTSKSLMCDAKINECDLLRSLVAHAVAEKGYENIHTRGL
jgi:hypothetical protein